MQISFPVVNGAVEYLLTWENAKELFNNPIAIYDPEIHSIMVIQNGAEFETGYETLLPEDVSPADSDLPVIYHSEIVDKYDIWVSEGYSSFRDIRPDFKEEEVETIEETEITIEEVSDNA